MFCAVPTSNFVEYCIPTDLINLDSSIPSFVLVRDKVQFLQPYGLVVKDCNPVLFRVRPQPMFHQRLFDLVVQGEWLLWFSKPWLVRAFACVLIFSACLVYVSSSDSFRTIIKRRRAI